MNQDDSKKPTIDEVLFAADHNIRTTLAVEVPPEKLAEVDMVSASTLMWSRINGFKISDWLATAARMLAPQSAETDSTFFIVLSEAFSGPLKKYLTRMKSAIDLAISKNSETPTGIDQERYRFKEVSEGLDTMIQMIERVEQALSKEDLFLIEFLRNAYSHVTIEGYMATAKRSEKNGQLHINTDRHAELLKILSAGDFAVDKFREQLRQQLSPKISDIGTLRDKNEELLHRFGIGAIPKLRFRFDS